MRNLNVIFALVIVAVFMLTSCQKDQMEDVSPTGQATSIINDTDVSFEKSPTDIELLKENVSQTLEIAANTKSATARNGGDQLIYDYEGYVGKNETLSLIHSKVGIGSSKYRVVLTSLTGDADLILAGENKDNQSWREIRTSNSGIYDDILEYTAWDLNYDEDEMRIIVEGFSSSSFRIEIFRVNETLSTCNNQSAIEKIKETLCFCEVNTLYHAEYFGRPALYVEQYCTTLLDAGGISVYDCDGNQIAYTGFYAPNPVQEDHLDIKGKIYECSNGNDCLWGDDFERYSPGSSVAYDDLGGYSELWSAWSSNSPSGIVTPNKTLEFWRAEYGKQDIVFNLGKKSSGLYKVSWKMYIESNSTAYFNIQDSNYRNEFKGGGEHRITFGQTLSQYQNRWFNVEVYFDLDQNKLKVIIDDGRYESEINYTANMGGINFYAIQNAHFYLDNVCVKEVNEIPLTDKAEQASSRSRSNDEEISTTGKKN